MAQDYKDTLQLAHTPFPIRPDHVTDDAAMLSRWHREDLATKSMQMNHGAEKFILHDGPPYANGDIHLGHAYNMILKDIVGKSKRMGGMHVPIIPGWDCHGLPIEHKVLQDPQLATADRTTVIAACRTYANGWIDKQKNAFEALGALMDWKHPYITMAPSYEAATLRALQTLVERKFIVRKYKTVAWCFQCQTTLASAEIEYQERKDPSIYVAFPLDPTSLADTACAGAAFAVWTTTPWTLPLNRAVALHPEAPYALVSVNGRKLIIGAGCLASMQKALQTDITVEREFPAQYFAGARVQHPFIPGFTVPILFADHVSTTDGTAAVHTAPGCGPEDYELGVKQGLEIYAPVAADGRYTDNIIPESLRGLRVSEVHGTIIRMIEEAGNLLAKGSIRHSYAHCWRCRTGLIYRATQQWFFDLRHIDIQKSAYEAADTIKFIPKQGAQFLRAAVENRWEWCLSRQRVWGVPIPAIICTECDYALLDPHIIAQVATGVANEGIEFWQTVPLADIVRGRSCPQCSSHSWKKELDILDVWFDSGISHAAVLNAEHGQSFPADLYLEGIDQYRGWYQSSLLTALALAGKPPMRMIMSHGFTVDDKGRKMSKSLGNVVAPAQLIQRLGTDGLRLWAASIDVGSDVVVSESVLKNVEQVYHKIRNSCRFMLQNVGSFDPAHALPFEKLMVLDQIMLMKFAQFHERIRTAYDQYDTVAIFHTTADFCTTDLSALYFDCIKDRLYTEPADARSRQSAQTVLWHILDGMTRLLAPVLSFTMEQIAEHYQHPWTGSVHLNQFVAANAIVPVALETHDPRTVAWEQLGTLRDGIMRVLERERERGLLKHSRQAKLELWYKPESALGTWIKTFAHFTNAQGEQFDEMLAEYCVIASATITESDKPAAYETYDIAPGVYGRIVHAEGNRCPRCWRWRVSTHADGLCQRCSEIIQQFNT